MQAFNKRIAERLAERENSSLSRTIKTIEQGNSVNLIHNGKKYINFANNDYLGLAGDDELKKAWQQGIELYGCGSGASPLVTGFSKAHRNLEQALCNWLDYPRAILFGSGFSANQALLACLLEKGDLLLQDRLNHASLMEAGMLSPADMRRFRHNDVSHLSQLIDANRDTLVVTEGVFSMDGDLSPLKSICNEISDKALLCVDDAHGIGVLGREGKGSCHFHNVKPQVQIITFGKAFGLSGAAILCDEMLGDYLTQFARHHVYSTAIPPSQAYALTHAVNMVRSQDWRRDVLSELQEHFDKCFGDLEGYVQTQTPIKPFILGESDRALALSERLQEEKMWVTAIRPPTVPNQSARLRITLTANHSKTHIDRLASSVKKALGA
ncbi:8-amino-7-oxononanoate synthase [Vibrio sonorensis]|uniref:8-amino-7-oxononanoate synthase n=1 Tax=Vibrio sonorensis TaxID=1004316 RepID=UPI0008DA4304|nr:8-amino-7-oxononanoate synthase [Vibrio sonorensis]